MTDLERIRQRLADYYTPDEVEMWLGMPHPQLDNELPVDLIAAGRAADVDRVLDRLDAGAYL